MINRSTRFAFYALVAVKALMWCDAPVPPTTAAVTDAVAVKCREGAKEYDGPRFGVSSQTMRLWGMRHA